MFRVTARFTVLILKTRENELTYETRGKKTLLGLVLKLILHQNAQLLALPRSLFTLIAKRLQSSKTQNNEVLSEKRLGIDAKFSDRSLMYVKISSGSSMEP